MFFFTAPGSQIRVAECSNRFRRVLRQVFQGIQVAKTSLAIEAESTFNEAQASGNTAILKFISFGLEVEECFAVGKQLHLRLRKIGHKHLVITLCDVPSAFVAR